MSPMVHQTEIELRLGVVSYLNTLPLIDGLERAEGVRIFSDVPSKLAGVLEAGETDLSLCSVIDQQRAAVPLTLVPVGQIGCDGATWTVRLFSRRPLPEIEEVACDTDSHTSVALLRVLLSQQHGLRPLFTPIQAQNVAMADWPDVVLLIGDKVVRSGPCAETHPFQLDLGAAWHELTGLPFVFASWFCRADIDGPARERVRRLAIIVDHARRRNARRIPSIAHQHAEAHGWRTDQAIEYLDTRLRFECTPRSIESIRVFLDAAAKIDAIPDPQPLQIADDVLVHA
jgi:chorismate dehydratase